MFPRSLLSTPSGGTSHQDPESKDQYTITDRAYGKDTIKVLHVKRDGPVHSINEFDVIVHIKLATKKDYLHGDTSDIIDSDALKNITFVLAKKHGIENPEKFALLLSSYMLNKYAHVAEIHIHIDQSPWERIAHEKVIQADDKNLSVSINRQKHNHAFVLTPTEVRYCDVVTRRTDPKQTVISGIKGMRVLKTTQSQFVNFVTDEFRLTPDLHDRCFCAIVDCSWEYSNINDAKFCQTWNDVKSIIADKFAGDPIKGITSYCLQNTCHLIEREILDVIPQIPVVAMTLQNKHYINFDTKPFQSLVPGENNEVFISLDTPFSTVYAQLARKDIKNNL